MQTDGHVSPITGVNAVTEHVAVLQQHAFVSAPLWGAWGGLGSNALPVLWGSWCKHIELSYCHVTPENSSKCWPSAAAGQVLQLRYQSHVAAGIWLPGTIRVRRNSSVVARKVQTAKK